MRLSRRPDADLKAVLCELWHRDHVRFPTLFLVYASLGMFAYIHLNDESSLLKPAGDLLVSSTAGLVAWTSLLSGASATPEGGNVLSFGGAARYQVIMGCTGLSVMILFASGVLAYPSTWRQRGWGFLVGVPTIFVVNILRLVSLGWLGRVAPDKVEVVHLFWWQAFLVAMVGAGWLAWARWASRGPSPIQPLTTTARIFRSVGRYVFILVGLAALGIVVRLAGAYGWLVWNSAVALARLVWGDGRVEAPTTMDSLAALGVFAGLSALTALYLAMPEASWPARLRGALLWGVPSKFGSHVFLIFVNGAVRGGLLEPSWWVHWLSLIGPVVVPFAVWFTWAHRQGLLTRAARARYRCPDCGREWGDVLIHFEQAHKRRARTLRRAFLAEHPEVRRDKNPILARDPCSRTGP